MTKQGKNQMQIAPSRRTTISLTFDVDASNVFSCTGLSDGNWPVTTTNLDYLEAATLCIEQLVSKIEGDEGRFCQYAKKLGPQRALELMDQVVGIPEELRR